METDAAIFRVSKKTKKQICTAVVGKETVVCVVG